MKRITHFLLMLLIASSSFGQMINNRLNVYGNFEMGNFLGPQVIKEGNFTSPSLFANMHQVTGFSVKALVETKKYFGIGFALTGLTAANWSTSSYSDYSNSTASLHSLSPVIQFHNPFKPAGFFNRAKLFFEIGPTAGWVNLKLATPLFDIHNQNATMKEPLSGSNTYAGVLVRGGVELIVSHQLGFNFSYSFQHDWVASELYNDKSFTATQASAGLFLRLKNNKRFYY